MENFNYMIFDVDGYRHKSYDFPREIGVCLNINNKVHYFSIYCYECEFFFKPNKSTPSYNTYWYQSRLIHGIPYNLFYGKYIDVISNIKGVLIKSKDLKRVLTKIITTNNIKVIFYKGGNDYIYLEKNNTNYTVFNLECLGCPKTKFIYPLCSFLLHQYILPGNKPHCPLSEVKEYNDYLLNHCYNRMPPDFFKYYNTNTKMIKSYTFIRKNYVRNKEIEDYKKRFSIILTKLSYTLRCFLPDG
jgi:hypothetical protein